MLDLGTLSRLIANRLPGVVTLLESVGLQLSSTDTLPTCDVTQRTVFRSVRGGAGVADRVVICEKSAADAYAWHEAGLAALDGRYQPLDSDLTDLATGVYNEAGADKDFRIEGDTATNLFVVDAGLDAVMVGTTVVGAVAIFANSAIIINGDGANRDTTIQGDTDVSLFVVDASADAIGIGTNAPAGSKLDINDDSIRIRTSKTPASASATGTQGEFAWDSSFVYVCIATDTWKRAAIATW